MRTACTALILLCFFLYSGHGYSGLSAFGKPLRVIIHKVPKKTDSHYRDVERAVTKYTANIDWSAVLDHQFYAGTGSEGDDFRALDIKLKYYGDRNYALEKMEIRDHRLYDGASDILVNPMYILQTGTVGSRGGFSAFGQDWLRMNIKTIDTLAHWTSRRSMSLGLYTASKHFNNNRILPKSADIMKDRERRKYHE